jgi:hypothetical protein
LYPFTARGAGGAELAEETVLFSPGVFFFFFPACQKTVIKKSPTSAYRTPCLRRAGFERRPQRMDFLAAVAIYGAA